jgi:hypothetical protein
MKTNIWKNRGGTPSDEEIERDVSELRRLLSGVEEPREPHPAYYQNFLVKVRGRIDEQGGRRKRLAVPSAVWASLSAAVVVVALAVGGVFSPTQPGGQVASTIAKGPTVDPAQPAPLQDFASLYHGQDIRGLVLSESDVQMVNAINSGDENAIFDAMADSDNL